METRTQWLERKVRENLAESRWKELPVTMLELFTAITSIDIASFNWSPITASDFNKAVGDLRKIGILDTRGPLVWLSDAAWSLVKQQFPPKPQAAAPIFRANNPFGGPEVRS
jgi:hypothetical protein